MLGAQGVMSLGSMQGWHPKHPSSSPQFLREEYYQGRYCAVWQNITRWEQKKNVYTLWVTNSSCGVAPVHYEMRGYNSLLGSHYDKYEISYTEFDNSFPPSVFDVPVNGERGWGPTSAPGRTWADGVPLIAPQRRRNVGCCREAWRSTECWQIPWRIWWGGTDHGHTPCSTTTAGASGGTTAQHGSWSTGSASSCTT